MTRKATAADIAVLAEMAAHIRHNSTTDELRAEFASDCELDNADSYRFHLAMGFDEANRVICFTKPICGTKERR